MWVPLSQAIVSGMAFAALLTLVATPAMLALPYKISAQLATLKEFLEKRTGSSALRQRLSLGKS
ncbi:MAG: hypothetical protein VXA40_07805, partial [Gammaproteobacteria bacterium]